MSYLFRFLLFVPPSLLFFLPAATSQIQGKIEQVSGSFVYQVSLVPTVNWMPPQSVTSSGQMTLRAATGQLSLTDLQSQLGIWSLNQTIVAPAEAPLYDYFTFSLQQAVAGVSYEAGVSISVFSFSNASGCSPIELIDNQTDPFLPPNSANVNIGNAFGVIGAGVGQNAYAGNASPSFAGCAPLDLVITAASNPVSCYGDLSSINVQINGGVAPFVVEWINDTQGTNGSGLIDLPGGSLQLDAMQPGLYFFSILDALDSIRLDTLLLQEPAALNLQLASFDASCQGSLDGVAFVDKINGGTVAGDYQYFWENLPGSSAGPSIGFLNPGTYTVTVQDDNGCQVSGSVEVNTFSVIYPNAITKDVLCYGASNGVVDLYPVSPNPPYTYQWSANVITGDYSSAYQLGPGVYQVTITDATGVCFEVAEYAITEPPAMSVAYSVVDPKCFGDKGALKVETVVNAFEPWTADIIGDGQPAVAGQDFLLEPGQPMTLHIQDDRGCTWEEEFLVPAKQQLLLDLGEDMQIKYGQEVQFDPDYFPFYNVNFEWSADTSLSCSDCPDPLANPVANTNYHVVMTDTAGCKVEDEVTVGVYKSRDIFIPNAFSPNFDGINDKFVPYAGFEVKSIHYMKLFDRWGGLIYDAGQAFVPNHPSVGWDGMAHGRMSNAGVYLYSMDVEFIDGEVVQFSGAVNLMR